MFEKIVVPLNGLPSAEVAIAPAAELARQHGGELHYVSVVGTGVEAITGYVTKIDADLVVMATHGRTGWRHAWAGSMADDLLRTLNGRLLLVRIGDADAGPAAGYRRILVGLDGSSVAERALEGALAVARAAHSTIVLARVVTPLPGKFHHGLDSSMIIIDNAVTHPLLEKAQRYLDDIADRIRREDGLEVETVVGCVAGSSPRSAAARQLAAIVREQDIDLVSLTTRKRGASRLLLRSVADRVLSDTQCALLLCGGRAAFAERELWYQEPATSVGNHLTMR